MAELRTRLKYTRLNLEILANALSRLWVSANSALSFSGWPNWTKVWRPWIQVPIKRRNRPPVLQFSENNTLKIPEV